MRRTKNRNTKRRKDVIIFLLILVAIYAIFVAPYLPLHAYLFKVPGTGSPSTPDVGPLVSLSMPVTSKNIASYGLSGRFAPDGRLIQLGNQYGEIFFITPVDVPDLYASDFRDVEITYNKAYIDSAADRFADFRRAQARITLYNVPYFPGVSSIIRYTNTGMIETCNDCRLLSYRDGKVVFTVPGFSGYGIDNPTPPTQDAALLTAATLFNTTYDDLTCNALGTFDADGDTVITNYQFITDDVNYTLLSYSFDVNTSTADMDALKDFSGNEFNGTLGGGVDYVAPIWVGLDEGKIGGAYKFDGVDDFINRSSVLDLSLEATFEAWVNMTDNSDYSVIAAEGGWQRGYSLGTNDGNGNIFFAVRNDSAATGLFMVTFPASILQLNEYYHLTGVYDGLNGMLLLYLNGMLVNTSAGPAVMYDPIDGLSVGGDINTEVLAFGNPGYFSGTIDQLMMFDKVLTSMQINSHSKLNYNVIDDSETSAGETWKCVTVPTDGYYIGASNESNSIIIMDNQAPTQDQPLIYSTSGLNVSSDDYTCLAQGTYDFEAGSVRNLTTFTLNLGETNILFLPFEDDQNSITRDYSGYGNDGTVLGGTFLLDYGAIGNSYFFNTQDDAISVADNSVLDFDNSTNFTIEAWFAGVLNQGAFSIISKGDVTNAPGYDFYVDGSSNLIIFKIRDPEGSFQVSASSSLLNVILNHIAVTVDRNGDARMYVNGQLASSQLVRDINGDTIGNLTNDDDIYIGKNTYNLFSLSFAELDEVMVYNHILTQGQINNHYNKQYSVMDNTMMKKGQQISCAVTPHDGFEGGVREISNTIDVVNSAPTHNNPTLSTPSSLGLDNENLTCLHQNTQDADGDAVREVYAFVLDDLPLNVVYLPFETQNNFGTSTDDFSGYDNDGVVSGAVFDGSGGKIGGAYRFDGVNDYINVPDDDSLDLIYDFTAEFWVKFDALGDNMPLITKSTDAAGVNDMNYEIRTGSGANTDELEFLFDTGGSTVNVYATTSSNLQIGQYYHMVIVKPYGSAPEVYINSILQNANCAAGNCANYLEESNDALKIGRGLVGASYNYFEGYIDEARIYDFPITYAQIKENFGLGYNKIIDDMTLVGDEWYCTVTPHDGETYGQTKQSNTVDIEDQSSGGGGGSGGGEGTDYIFHWHTANESTVTYTLQPNWEVWIHDLPPITSPKTIYVTTVTSIDYQNGRTGLDIYPNIGSLDVYDKTVYVDMDVDGVDDITIDASGLGYETVTLRFALTGSTTTEPNEPPDEPEPPEEDKGDSNNEPPQNQGGYKPSYPVPTIEKPSTTQDDISDFFERLKMPAIPYRSMIVTLLIILIIITFFFMMKRIKSG